MFQPFHDRLPSQYELMPLILGAIHQMVGCSKSGVHYTHVEDWIEHFLLQQGMVADADVLSYTTDSGNEPLIKVRIGNGGSLLRKERLMQNGNIPGKVRGNWALTPKGCREMKSRGLGDGGVNPPPNPNLPSRRSGSRSLVRSQSQNLARSNEWTDINAWMEVIVRNSRDFTLEEETRPDGTKIRRIRARK